jgi:di/tricarboxylate transporter
MARAVVLLVCGRWVGNPLPLQALALLALVLLLLMRRVGWALVVHRLVPGRSTVGRSYHNLPLLCFLVGVDCLICDDDITDKLWE